MRLASHAVYREFVTGFGLEFYPLGGDPKAGPQPLAWVLRPLVVADVWCWCAHVTADQGAAASFGVAHEQRGCAARAGW